MALSAYLRLTGETQGEIKGGVTQAGREESIEVYGFHHEIMSPRDPNTGQVTGQRQHRALSIVKALDRASPILFNVLASSETITQFRMELFRPNRSGREELYYTIELQMAHIANLRTEQLNNRYADNATHEAREHISFVYQKIIVTYTDGGIQGEDDWQTMNT